MIASYKATKLSTKFHCLIKLCKNVSLVRLVYSEINFIIFRYNLHGLTDIINILKMNLVDRR